MPRTYKLTWQAGNDGRKGRWRKKYKGRNHYFPGGNGKTDRQAYLEALAKWETLKVDLDRNAIRQHEQVYKAAIDEWERVLSWSSQHADTTYVDLATSMLDKLRRQFKEPKLPPLSRSDQFESVFDPPELDYSGMLKNVRNSWPFNGPELPQPPSRTIDLTPVLFKQITAHPWQIARERWRDRLANLERKMAPADESFQTQFALYLRQFRQKIDSKDVSAGRVDVVTRHLNYFQDWFGKDRSVKEIDGQVLMDYHGQLVQRSATKKWTRTTANQFLSSLKSFVRWLWQTNAIANLPRVMDGKSKILTISNAPNPIVVFTIDEIRLLLHRSTDRMKLYLLLMLNTAMTQKDVSDLLVSEVDWKQGRIIRKRSKTGDFENVPLVNYKLWPETFRLLLQERTSENAGPVLRNANGGPLWTEQFQGDDKYRKIDNIKSAFSRLNLNLTINKPLKSLKKTSASLLRNNERFSNLESLFLGHAPKSMAEKHYAQIPQTLFDAAVEWLGTNILGPALHENGK